MFFIRLHLSRSHSRLSLSLARIESFEYIEIHANVDEPARQQQ